jgi:hypothetical protein
MVQEPGGLSEAAPPVPERQSTVSMPVAEPTQELLPTGQESNPDENVIVAKKYVPSDAMAALATAMRSGLSSSNSIHEGTSSFQPSKMRQNSGEFVMETISPIPPRRPDTIHVVESSPAIYAISPTALERPRPATMFDATSTSVIAPRPLIAAKPRPASTASELNGAPPVPSSRPSSLVDDTHSKASFPLQDDSPTSIDTPPVPVRTSSQSLNGSRPVLPRMPTRPTSVVSSNGDSPVVENLITPVREIPLIF